MSYFKHIKQDVVADANNSSTTNLAVGNSYTFTGVMTSTLGVAGIQVSLYADKPCTVQVQQSPDATPHWDITDTFNYYTTKTFGITVQAISSYVRIVVTTKGTNVSTGTFRLQTALCPIIEAVPRTLDEDGLFQTRISKIKGDMGRVRISPMGAMKAASSVRLAGAGFVGSIIDPAFWSTTVVGTGAVSQVYAEMTLTTAATANSSIIVNSVKVARYIAANPNYFRGNIQCPTVTTASGGYTNIRRWGSFNASDGVFFLATQTNPATTPTLSIVTRKTDGGGLLDIPVASGSFNGDWGATFTMDTNVHTYEIWFTNKHVYFYIDDVLLHTVTASTTTVSGSLSLPVGMQTINSGGNTGANTLIARSATINRLGNMATMPAYKNITGNAATTVIKYTGGYLHRLIFNNTSGTSIALWDGTTGAAPSILMGTITTAAAALGPWDVFLPFFNGLTIVTVGNGLDVTLIFE